MPENIHRSKFNAIESHATDQTDTVMIRATRSCVTSIFRAGLKRTRELEHDTQIFEAYLHVAEQLQERGARVERVSLDYELKRDYQKWLHEHDLPYFDDQVHFPDLRIEYEEVDGRREHEDIEVLTVHYRGTHASAASKSGFSCYGVATARTGGRGPDPDLASELIR